MKVSLNKILDFGSRDPQCKPETFTMTLALFAASSAFTLGLLGLTLNRVHLLSALLCLEGIILSLFIALSL